MQKWKTNVTTRKIMFEINIVNSQSLRKMFQIKVVGFEEDHQMSYLDFKSRDLFAYLDKTLDPK